MARSEQALKKSRSSQRYPSQFSFLVAKIMSDREGGSGGVPPTDEDLSLPKATVAKMITGNSVRDAFVLFVSQVYPLILAHRFTTQRRNMCQRNTRSHHRVLRWWGLRQVWLLPLVLTKLRSDPEFIHLISSEANEICDQESKKTIAPEHIIGALKVSHPSCRRVTVNLLHFSVSVSTHLQQKLKMFWKIINSRLRYVAPGISQSVFVWHYMLHTGSWKEGLKIRAVRFDRGATTGRARKTVCCQSSEISGRPAVNFVPVWFL